MTAHTAAGRRFGLSWEEIDRLAKLDPEHFERREWVALKYAQDRVFLGCKPTGPILEEFCALYSEKERAHIDKLVCVQEFANYWMNTFSRRAWKKDPEGQSCSLPQ